MGKVTHKMRRDYFWSTLAMFLSVGTIYGLLPLIVPGAEATVWQALGVSLFAGYCFTSIVHGVILFIRWISQRSLAVKILCGVFFLIPFAAIAYVGIFSFLPYGIYNLVRLLTGKDKEEKAE